MDGWLRIGTKIDDKQTDKQLTLLKHKLKQTEKEIELLNKTMADSGFTDKAKDDLIQMEANAEKLRKQINQIQFPDMDKSQKTKKGFDNLYKSAKKFALGILSVRTAYTIISKASSSYLATDEKTTSQLEANWVGLGTIMEPIIKFIIDLMKKAVTSVLYFMSALTGIDYIAKANANALKKQENATNSLKKANDKLTSSFDEMEVLNSPSASSATGSSIDTSALFDIADIGEDARKTIEKIAKALQPVYKVIKDIIKWCSDNPEMIIGMLGGIALLTMLSKVIGVAGVGTVAGTGLAGVYGLLLAIASISVITISIKTVVDSYNDLQNTLETVEDMGDTVVDANNKMNGAYRDFIKNNKNGAESVQELSDQLLNQIDTLSEHNQNVETSIDELGVYEKMWWNATGATEANGKAMFDNTEQIFNNVASLVIAEKQGKLTKEQSERLTEQLKKLTTETDIATLSTEELASRYDLTTGEAQLMKDMIKNVGDEHVNYMNKTYGATEETKNLETAIKNMPNKKNIEIDVETEKATRKTKSWWRELINNVISVPINTLSKNLGLNFKIPYLATGGIINNPGRGVPLGGAIGGEVNKEGVIPLTDSQAMEELGQTIGKYVNINFTNITRLDNRQIAREQKKINAQNDFAMNR